MNKKIQDGMSVQIDQSVGIIPQTALCIYRGRGRSIATAAIGLVADCVTIGRPNIII